MPQSIDPNYRTEGIILEQYHLNLLLVLLNQEIEDNPDDDKGTQEDRLTLFHNLSAFLETFTSDNNNQIKLSEIVKEHD